MVWLDSVCGHPPDIILSRQIKPVRKFCINFQQTSDHCALYSAPSPPRSLLVTQNFSSKSVTVTWAPPLQANGILQYYGIFLQSGDSRPPSDLKRGRKTVSVPQKKVVLRQLTPFTTYYVWVAAINVQRVELISELAGPVNFTTAIEGTAYIHWCMC